MEINFFKFCFLFFLFPRCLLTDLVYWVKRELKTFVLKKKFTGLIHLTPFAWRSGQTSSMLGGAQFKATLPTKSICQRFTMQNDRQHSHQGTENNGKRLSAAWKLQLCGVAHSCRVHVSRWAEGNSLPHHR